MPTLECVHCRRQIAYTRPDEVPFRPFCSARCQLIDLGKWLNEEYRVSEEIPPEFAGDEARPARPERGENRDDGS